MEYSIVKLDMTKMRIYAKLTGGHMIERNQYLDKLIRKKENGLIKVITGLRRSGKSFLLKEIYFNYLINNGIDTDHIIIVDLDDDQNIKYRNPLFLSEYIRDSLKDEKMYYVFLDEIQKVVTIENPYVKDDKISFVDILLGLMKIKNIDLYVTGSNSKMLSSDILTEFRDRGDEVKVYPLTFKEVYDSFGGDKSAALSSYLYYGGMPRVYAKNEKGDKEQYLRDLFKQTYLKDIVERNKIANDEITLEEIMSVVASSVGSLLSYSKLAKTYQSRKNKGISPETIKKYLDYFVDAFLLERVNRYDIKGRKYIDGPVKYYYSDVGIRNANLNFRQQEENHLMENVIYNELVARGLAVDVGSVTYNYKNAEKKSERKLLEIDFVVNRGSERIYLQSALTINDTKKRIQETNSLLGIKDSFKKIIIVRDFVEPWFDENGILIIGLFDFLTNQSLL